MDITKDKLLEMYRSMQRIRHFESKIRDLATANEIPGFVHVSIGEEASAAGICARRFAKPIASRQRIAATAI